MSDKLKLTNAVGPIAKWAEDREQWAILEVVDGVEGPCLVLNDRRIAGPKPWGGGTITHRWFVGRMALEEVIAEKASEANLIALARSNEQLRTGLEMAVNALGHLWSAIGDRLFAQGPLAKEYGQGVARDVNLAREAALRALSKSDALLARRSSKAVELERVAEAHLFPLQPAGRKYKGPAVPSLRIPWIVAEKAYAAYAARYGQDQSLERLAERGGLSVEEMDEFFPAWREECDRIRELGAALIEAMQEIQIFHGPGWDLFRDHSPEMDRWRSLLHEGGIDIPVELRDQIQDLADSLAEKKEV